MNKAMKILREDLESVEYDLTLAEKDILHYQLKLDAELKTKADCLKEILELKEAIEVLEVSQ